MSDPARIALPLRLVIRLEDEGRWWVARLALPETLEGAQEIGRLLASAVRIDPETKGLFTALATRIATKAYEDLGLKGVEAEVMEGGDAS